MSAPEPISHLTPPPIDPQDDGDEEEVSVPRVPPTLKDQRKSAESMASLFGGLMLCGVVASFVLRFNGSPIAMPVVIVTALLASTATFWFRRAMAMHREERTGH